MKTHRLEVLINGRWEIRSEGSFTDCLRADATLGDQVRSRIRVIN